MATASSTSYADVRAAVEAASSGETVNIPAGSSDWNGSAVTIPSGVSVIGAGTGNTNLTDALWYINADIRLSAITHIIASRGETVYLNQAGNGWRIDNCAFTNSGTSSYFAIWVRGPYSGSELCPYGLVDNCSFQNCKIYVLGNAQLYNDPGYIFLQDTLLGTMYAVYVEDCTFQFLAGQSAGNCIDENYGGRYVLRHCTMTDTYPEVHAPEHAINNEPQWYGSRSFEIYENTLESTGDKSHWSLGRIRGGTGVIYNNAFSRSGGSNSYVMIFDYSPEASGDYGLSYPAPCQLGRGKWPAGTPIYNCSAGGAFPEQNLEPVYCWGNTIDSGDWYLNNSASLVQTDRDIYFSTVHPTYTAYTYPHPLRGETPAPVVPVMRQGVRLRFG